MVIVLKNDEYGILNVELAHVREGEINEKVLSLVKLGNPSIEWLQLAQGMGFRPTHADNAGISRTTVGSNRV